MQDFKSFFIQRNIKECFMFFVFYLSLKDYMKSYRKGLFVYIGLFPLFSSTEGHPHNG